MPPLDEEDFQYLRFVEAKNDTIYSNRWPRIFIAVLHLAIPSILKGIVFKKSGIDNAAI
jgi:hypothetical protein